MLKSVNGRQDEKGAVIAIKDASFPSPFVSGLEYSPPARGAWNIVHTGMLVPEAHEIFVCAQGCLRGVVLTAAEMKAEHRFSTVAVRENNVLDGDMESLIIDGVADIIDRLQPKPKAVLLYTSCIHHFMGCDLALVYRVLRGKYPEIDFTDAYMNPIMRKSGLTPDQLLRRNIYKLLKPRKLSAKTVNIIGNNLPTDESSEIYSLAAKAGAEIKDITRCCTYEEFQSMASASANISYNSLAVPGGEYLEKTLGQKSLYLPLSYGYEEIESNLQKLTDYLGVAMPDYTEAKKQADTALNEVQKLFGNTPLTIDYTATLRPLGLARLLIEHGFIVQTVYVDCINGEEEADFQWLKKHCPELKLAATVHVKMRVLNRISEEKTVAIGQKAAYFTGTNNFVNIVEGGGMYGFDGICRLAELMKDAYLHEKDAKKLIQIKGLGCCCR
ncbi:MAG: nitrogenase component 1 [Bacillota bacterium]|jgi:hypothetical protein